MATLYIGLTFGPQTKLKTLLFSCKWYLFTDRLSFLVLKANSSIPTQLSNLFQSSLLEFSSCESAFRYFQANHFLN